MTAQVRPADDHGNDPASEAVEFFTLLHGDQDGYLVTFSGTRQGEKLASPRERYHAWPAEAAQAGQHVANATAAGQEVYACAHLLTKQKRIKANAAPVSVLWVDHDRAGWPNDAPRPTAIVESSPGRWQVYVRLTEAIEPARAERLNKRLTAMVGADPSGFDLTQLLRVPGTINHKYEGMPPVRLIHEGGEAYDPDELEQMLPPLEQPAPIGRVTARTSSGAPSNASDEDDDRLLARARAAENGVKFAALFDHGDTSAYAGDASRADLALCDHLKFWFGHDPGRIDRVFRRSKLFRDKWDERHYGDGRTYGQGTIDKALADGGEVYQPRPPLRVFVGGQSQAGNRANGSGPGMPGDPPNEDGQECIEPPHLTDMGNAQRLHRDHGGDLRYCKTWKRWQVWDGARWQDDDTDQVVHLAKTTVRGIYIEAGNAADEESRKALAKHASRSEAEGRVRAMIGLAETEPGIPARPDDFDRHPWLLTCRNGTLDLRTGELLPHDRGHLITKLAPVEYDPDAECPVFLAFLDRIMAGNQGLIQFLQRAAGYSVTGDTSERVLMILHGEGRNGKSTFLEVLRSILGDYAIQTPTDTLMAKREAGIPNDIAQLKGARFVSASESDEGRRLDEAKIKSLSGGDTVSARFMRGEFFNFTPEFKLWLGTNHKPTIRGTDRAIWDRIRLVPFSVRIPEAEQDKQLRAKLLAEAPGILAWAVRGCLNWQRDGLGEPREVREATAGYRAEMDVLGEFIEERCVVNPRARVSAKDLYAAYQQWCSDTGEKPLSQKALGQRLDKRGLDTARVGKSGSRYRIGIGLRGEGYEDLPHEAADVSERLTHADALSDISDRDTEPRELSGKTRQNTSADQMRQPVEDDEAEGEAIF